MTSKGLAELRRRLNPDYRNPTILHGCYVSPDGKVLSCFSKEIVSLTTEDNENYMGIFKKLLSGTFGQNLLDLEFPAADVLSSEHFQLLGRLLETGLKEEESLKALFEKVVAAVPDLRQEGDTQSVTRKQEEARYLVLALFDGYDVPYKDENGEKDAERSSELFRYMLCCVCPVKQTKPGLAFADYDESFHTNDACWVAGMPEVGFLYPSFEERAADLYHVQYYTRDAKENHASMIQHIFGLEPSMPAAQQKESFTAILQESLGEECSLDVVQTVHEAVCERLEARKEEKDAQPLNLSGREVKEILAESGISPEKTETFEQKFEDTFGPKAEVPAVNLISPKQFSVSTASVSIKVEPGFTSCIETRVIDGRKYILVPADEGVEVNGIRVQG